MIDDNDLKIVDKGAGFTIGELAQSSKDFWFLKQGALVMKFDGVDNILDFVSQNMTKAKRSKSSDKGEGGNFNAFASYDEAMQTFRSNPQSVVEFDPAELRIKDDTESGSRVEYDVVGDYIDMGRYMEGIPEAWGSMRSGNSRNRRVNIMVNLNQVWFVRHKDITHRGERILRLVDALEAGGVRTQLTGIDCNECGYTEVLLKRHEEPLTISDLAVVTHPEFKRRLIFRINENSKTWDYGYGNAMEFGDAVNSKPELLASNNNDEMNIFIGGSMEGIDYIDRMFDQLEKLLVWEMSKPVPEVDAVKIDSRGIYFNANGARPEADIQREGREAINAD